jgi:hypothetical protein
MGPVLSGGPGRRHQVCLWEIQVVLTARHRALAVFDARRLSFQRVAVAAWMIMSATASGWEIIERCEAGISSM